RQCRARGRARDGSAACYWSRSWLSLLPASASPALPRRAPSRGPRGALPWPGALPELAQRLLVLAREPPRRAPARQVVEDDPERRDDDEEDDAEDEPGNADHHGGGALACGFGTDAVAEPLLQGLQLLLDAVLGIEPGELV